MRQKRCYIATRFTDQRTLDGQRGVDTCCNFHGDTAHHSASDARKHARRLGWKTVEITIRSRAIEH